MNNNNNIKNLGILGGTFDPIHNGHIGCALAAMKHFDLDEVWFMPAKLSNFKQNQYISEIKDRIAMCKLAIKDANNKKFKLCDLETKRQGVSYTSDTLEILHKQMPNTNLYFISGSDVVFSLSHWHNIEDILKLACVIAVSRVGYSIGNDEALNFLDNNADRIKLIEADVLDVSSSDIRKAVSLGYSIDKYVCPSVKNYIEQNNLYKNASA